MLTEEEFERLDYLIKEAAMDSDDFKVKVATVLDIIAKFVDQEESKAD